MRTIRITNDKRRDTTVNFESRPKESRIIYVLPNGSPPRNVRLLKSTIQEDLSSLVEKYGCLENVAEELISHDPEIDLEKCGRLLINTKTRWISPRVF